MQYILTEEEYKNLVSKEKYDDALDKIERLNKKVLESLRDAERWITESTSMMFEPIERDKKGNVTKYKARFYVERTVKVKI